MQSTLPAWQQGRCLLCLIFCCSLLPLTHAEGAEITPFRLTGVNGQLSFRHNRDELEQGVVGANSSSSRRTSNEEEFSFTTESYVYHPNLLEMELGAGLLLTQNETRSSIDTSNSEDELLSLTAQLKFLKKKPYPVTAYYYLSNPTTQTGTDHFTSRNEHYGVNASVLEPVLPFSVNMELSRQTSEGTGVSQVVNQTNDQLFLRAYRNLGDGGNAQFTYHNRQQVSEGGLINQPIERTDSESESTSLASNHIFGERKQFKFGNLFSYYTQDVLPQRQEFHWSPNLEWQHSDNARSYYRLDYRESEANSIKTTIRSSSVGGNVALTEKWAMAGELHANESKTVGLQNQRKGTSGTISYKQPLSIGSLQLSAGAGYDLNENDSEAGIANQQNERLRYDGVQRLQLNQPFVVEVTSVIVERENLIVLVEENDDFIVVKDGPLTYLEILNKGLEQKIVNGDTLIVDYTYETGGTVTYETMSTNYSMQMSLFEHYALYASYSDTEQSLKEGFSSIPLNNAQYTRVGGRVDYPFANDKYRLGLETIYEKREEEISPYTRRTVSTSLQTALTSVTNLRLSLRRVQQDNLFSTEDVDLLARSLSLTTRPWHRASLRLEHSDDEDRGSSVIRHVRRNRGEIRWRIRKLILSGELSTIDEQQDRITRSSNYLSLNLTRTF